MFYIFGHGGTETEMRQIPLTVPIYCATGKNLPPTVQAYLAAQARAQAEAQARMPICRRRQSSQSRSRSQEPQPQPTPTLPPQSRPSHHQHSRSVSVHAQQGIRSHMNQGCHPFDTIPYDENAARAAAKEFDV
ncbi:hypothetical protein BT96DRAFT_1005648 [Gymnopus androsaceus JB14]|uniref:Uncharacterized protein n=1 Tax=Gymnopus androsaceus JB14 TaxID=1447944 RepID=A0A6A4GMD2_9AGAR|nr:hypothetical protein BT96DRAFT_1005648 [Gymnopus androsaceus JB14]